MKCPKCGYEHEQANGNEGYGYLRLFGRPVTEFQTRPLRMPLTVVMLTPWARAISRVSACLLARIASTSIAVRRA